MVHIFNGAELPAHDDNHFVGFPLWIVVLALAMPFAMKAMNDRGESSSHNDCRVKNAVR